VWLREFVECLEASTLKQSRIAEAVALKQRHMPERIYKYRCDSDYSRHNLKTDTVWLCSPDAYNDPYDCIAKLLEGPVIAALETRLVDEFVSSYKVQDGITADQIEKAKQSSKPLEYIAYLISRSNPATGNPSQMAEFCANFALPHLVGDMLSTIRLWREVTRVSSFSAVKDSLLMWGHYADKHRGFCVEYDLRGLGAEHPFRKFLYPVIYSNELYDLTRWAVKLAGPDRLEFNPEGPLLGVLHKFDGWKYEEEWRVVSVTPMVTADENWPVPSPTAVFLGSKMSPKIKKELLDICEQKKIQAHQMHLAEDSFQLVPKNP
jgi:hypothetical protein